MNVKRKREKSTRNFRKECRQAFFAVVEMYNQTRATVGHASAIDYEATQRSSAKYKIDIAFARVIDYGIDIHNAIKHTLNKDEFDFFNLIYLDKPDQSAKSTKEMMSIQERLGKVFKERGLFPISRYFNNPCKKIK